MKNLEMNGKTVEEATQRALEELGVGREEVRVTVLEEGRHGILGLNAREARIRVEPLVFTSEKESNTADVAKDVLETLLSMMEVAASVVSPAWPFVEEATTIPIAFDIKGDDPGILIGRHGQTLSCLQYIVRLIVGHQTETWVPIIIDVEGYKQRRYEALQALAWHIAKQVKAKEESFTLEPMSAYERRIIHITLADHPDVTTQSSGENEARKVVIIPKGQ
jgi:spoIIIJ-associated protein